MIILLSNLAKNPTAPKCYREIAQFLKTQGKLNESDAFYYLIEKRFGENDNSTNTDIQQRKNNQDNT